MGRKRTADTDQADLFSVDRSSFLRDELSTFAWPEAARFPVNHRDHWTGRLVRPDIINSPTATVIAGFASLAELIELAHAWAGRDHDGELRILLGSEPFLTERTSFGRGPRWLPTKRATIGSSKESRCCTQPS